MSKKVITLDVREDIQRGREPFSKIMQTVAGLGADEDLRLIAPFEPVPLFGVLAQRGFSHQVKVVADGSFEVLFSRKPASSPGAEKRAEAPAARPPLPGTRKQDVRAADHAACTGTPVLEVDARGLEPPQPLVKILEALATLPEGVNLRARTDRRPMHLYPQLEERGFVGESQEQEDGSFVTYVRRR